MEGLFQEGMHLDNDGMCKVHAEILHEFLMDTVINSGIKKNLSPLGRIQST